NVVRLFRGHVGLQRQSQSCCGFRRSSKKEHIRRVRRIEPACGAQKIAVFALPDRLGHQEERLYSQAVAQKAVCPVNETLQVIPEASVHRGEGLRRLRDIARVIGRKSRAPQEGADLACEQFLGEHARDTITVGRRHCRRCRCTPVRSRYLLRRQVLRRPSALAKQDQGTPPAFCPKRTEHTLQNLKSS